MKSKESNIQSLLKATLPIPFLLVTFNRKIAPDHLLSHPYSRNEP